MLYVCLVNRLLFLSGRGQANFGNELKCQSLFNDLLVSLLQVRAIIERLVRRCGMEAVSAVMPQEHMKLLTNIQKVGLCLVLHHISIL
jgi:hypothetical protein